MIEAILNAVTNRRLVGRPSAVAACVGILAAVYGYSKGWPIATGFVQAFLDEQLASFLDLLER